MMASVFQKDLKRHSGIGDRPQLALRLVLEPRGAVEQELEFWSNSVLSVQQEWHARIRKTDEKLQQEIEKNARPKKSLRNLSTALKQLLHQATNCATEKLGCCLRGFDCPFGKEPDFVFRLLLHRAVGQ